MSKDSCSLDFDYGSTRVSIKIDRTQKNRHKLVMYETKDGTYMWMPGHFAHDDVQLDSSPIYDLIGNQRDVFLSHLEEDAGYDNLRLSDTVLRIIQEVSS